VTQAEQGEEQVTPTVYEPMGLEEARRRMRAAIRVLADEGYVLQPQPEVCFIVVKPSGWRRHEVICVVGEHHDVVERFWSWDRADNLAVRLNAIRRTLS
jgi:hypothetical protein